MGCVRKHGADHQDFTANWIDPEPLEIIPGTNLSIGVSGSSPGVPSTGEIPVSVLQLCISRSKASILQCTSICPVSLASLQCNILLKLDKAIWFLDRPICLLPRTMLSQNCWLSFLGLEFFSVGAPEIVVIRDSSLNQHRVNSGDKAVSS